jgi:N-methylhydantoinase A
MSDGFQLRIGVDIGGTFTDLVVYDDADGRCSVEKVPTTPSSPEDGCIDAVRQLAAKNPRIMERCEYFLHGTTVGLNALVERRGPSVGLLCTAGFRDTLEIARGSRPEVFDLNWRPPEPLVPRYLRLPVSERIDAQGVVVRPMDERSVTEALSVFSAHEVASVAICLMNSYVNPAHEVEAERLLRKHGFKGDVSLSHRLSREYRDYERTSTTAIDAFVRARMANYLEGVANGLGRLGFKGSCLITRSGGGSMSFEEARERSFETINSGPVAGVEGAAELARELDIGDLVTADVGGTSFDTALIIDGRPHLLHQGEVAGMPIQSPWVDVRSIGAGGGSLAHVDVGGLLHVGPQSAGAQPGPACYGRGGTEATVTDAAFYLGMLGSGHLASGLKLDRKKAEGALQSVATQLGTEVQAVAIGIIRIACTNCANAIREITVEQGIDPRTLALLAFGGAGPLLATQMARELDIRRIVVPPFAGNFSAWGLLGSDLVRSAARTQRFALTADGVRAMNEALADMFSEFQGRGESRNSLEDGLREVAVGMRFSGGQEHVLTLPVPWREGRMAWSAAELERGFRDTYGKIFGVTLENAVEAIVLRTAMRRPMRRKLTRLADGAPPDEKLPDQRLYSFALEAERTARTLQRSSLKVGERHQGPAIIYEDTATTYVDTDFSYGLDANGCIVLTREE